MCKSWESSQEREGKRIACNHYDNIGRAMAASGEFDLVCFGHNHVYEAGRVGRALIVNPGPVMGVKFAPDGTAKWLRPWLFTMREPERWRRGRSEGGF